MNIPLSCIRLTRRSRLDRMVVGAMLCGMAGCGYTGGKFLYMMGVGRGAKVDAKFRLTDERILILIDDPGGRVTIPDANRFLFDELTHQLLENGAAKQLLPLESITRIRQTDPQFERRGCREIGRLAKASQVLWLEVRDYLGDTQITDANEAAYFSVAVKVIDTTEDRRTRVRVWPQSRMGHIVTATLTGSGVAKAKTNIGIAKALATEVAVEVAKLFYDHRLGDFEKEK